jgi:hypothetical protein
MRTRTTYPPAIAAATTPTRNINRTGRALSGASAIIALLESLGSDQHAATGDVLGLGHDHGKAHSRMAPTGAGLWSSTQICSPSIRTRDAIERRRRRNDATIGVASDM